jgi:hypothetical protein
MTYNPKTKASRLDRPDEDRVTTGAEGLPWSTEEARGALALDRDTAQHRRHHSRFEDLLN